MCNKYRSNTCCNATHVDLLKRPVHEARLANFNAKCREISDEFICRPCHPDVGTGRIQSVCPSLCNTWYSACQEEYYMVGLDGQLTPCYGDALVCSPLTAIAIE